MQNLIRLCAYGSLLIVWKENIIAVHKRNHTSQLSRTSGRIMHTEINVRVAIEYAVAYLPSCRFEASTIGHLRVFSKGKLANSRIDACLFVLSRFGHFGARRFNF